MSKHEKTSRRTAENAQLKTADRTAKTTIESNTPGAPPAKS